MSTDQPDQVKTERVSTLWDGAVGVATGTALAAINVLYFLRDSAFTQPATWIRVVVLVVAGLITALVWARWMRGRPVRSGSQLALTAVAMLTAIAMYVGVAQFVIHQRERAIDVTLPKEMAGLARVEPDAKERVVSELLLTAALVDDEFEAEYAMYEDPARPGAEYVIVTVTTAHRGTNAASGLADNFDDDITRELLSDATGVGESRGVDGAAGRFRCGQRTSLEGERLSVCAFAHGVRAISVVIPWQEQEPERLASTMLEAMLRA